MKKRWIYLIVALMVMSACSKDDDNGFADEIKGTYTGTVSSGQHDDMSVPDEAKGSRYHANIVIKPAGENKIEVTIDQLLNELNVTIPANVVSNEDGSYQFTGSQKVIIDGEEVDVAINGNVTKDGVIDASLTYKIDGKIYEVSFVVEKADKASENNLKQYEGTYYNGDFAHIFIEEEGKLYVMDIFYFLDMKVVKKFPLRVTKSGNSVLFTYIAINGDWSYAYTYKDNGLYLCEPNSMKYEKQEGIDYAYIAERSYFVGDVYANGQLSDHETSFLIRRTDKNKVTAIPWRNNATVGGGDGFVNVEVGIKDDAFTLKGTNISGTLKRGGTIEYKINDTSYKMEIDK